MRTACTCSFACTRMLLPFSARLFSLLLKEKLFPFAALLPSRFLMARNAHVRTRFPVSFACFYTYMLLLTYILSYDKNLFPIFFCFWQHFLCCLWCAACMLPCWLAGWRGLPPVLLLSGYSLFPKPLHDNLFLSSRQWTKWETRQDGALLPVSSCYRQW